MDLFSSGRAGAVMQPICEANQWAQWHVEVRSYRADFLRAIRCDRFRCRKAEFWRYPIVDESLRSNIQTRFTVYWISPPWCNLSNVWLNSCFAWVDRFRKNEVSKFYPKLSDPGYDSMTIIIANFYVHCFPKQSLPFIELKKTCGELTEVGTP